MKKTLKTGQTVKLSNVSSIPARYVGRRAVVASRIKRGQGFAYEVILPQRATPLTVAGRFLTAV